jgi:hypothetical protein
MENLTRIRFLTDLEGNKVEDGVWHFVDGHYGPDSPRVLCTGNEFITGATLLHESRPITRRGQLTCPECKAVIKTIKAIPL